MSIWPPHQLETLRQSYAIEAWFELMDMYRRDAIAYGLAGEPEKAKEAMAKLEKIKEQGPAT